MVPEGPVDVALKFTATGAGAAAGVGLRPGAVARKLYEAADASEDDSNAAMAITSELFLKFRFFIVFN